MGSSGSSSFSDYTEQQPTAENANNGGGSKIDKCNLAFACSLEEVSRCEYYVKTGMVAMHTPVLIRFNGVRLAAVDAASGVEIGYLPTRYNYLKNCLDNGFAYSGHVQAVQIHPMPTILIDIIPS